MCCIAIKWLNPRDLIDTTHSQGAKNVGCNILKLMIEVKNAQHYKNRDFSRKKADFAVGYTLQQILTPAQN